MSQAPQSPAAQSLCALVAATLSMHVSMLALGTTNACEQSGAWRRRLIAQQLSHFVPL